VKKRSDGLSVFLIDMTAMNKGEDLEVRPIKAMINHNTSEVCFDNFRIRAFSPIDEEGKEFRYFLDGLECRTCPRGRRWPLAKKGINILDAVIGLRYVPGHEHRTPNPDGSHQALRGS
jgi:hypothetical protein